MPSDPPKFRIEYRDSEGELEVIDTITDLDDAYNAIADLLDTGHEIWIRDTIGKGTSDAIANYVIKDTVINGSDEGRPLVVRRFKNHLVFKQDFDAAPFGIRSYKFYRRYLTKEELQPIFTDSMIARYEDVIKKQTKSVRPNKRNNPHH